MMNQYATAYADLMLQTSTAVVGRKHDDTFKDSMPTFPGNAPRRQETKLGRQCLKFKYLAYGAYAGIGKIVSHKCYVSRKRKPGS